MKNKIVTAYKNAMHTLNEKTNGKASLVLAAAAAVVVLLVVILVAVFRNPLYGTYEPGKLLYLSPLSSEHKTLYAEGHTEVKVSGKEFSVTYNEEVTTVSDPVYKTEEMTEELLTDLQNALQNKESGVSFDGAKKIHYICQEDGKASDYLFIEFEDAMWFVKYYVVGGRMDIWHIMEVDK